MRRNDVIVLDNIIESEMKEPDEVRSEDQYFQIFAFNQVLKQYELSYDELSDGNVDGGDDGGIDGIFTFLNGDLLSEDTDVQDTKRNPIIELIIIQVKNSESFLETAVERVTATLGDILDLDKEFRARQGLYNDSLVSKVETFRKHFLDLSILHPLLHIKFVYVSKGDTSRIHEKVKTKAKMLQEIGDQFFSNGTTLTDFIGAKEVLGLYRQIKSYSLPCKFGEGMPTGEKNYILLCSLADYLSFITDEEGELRSYLFDANVRAFQGSNVAVNKDIAGSLTSDDEMDFWWLNNGVTVLATDASVVGKTITLDDVQIVNGLQTTQIIFDYFKSKTRTDRKDEERSLLLRIIVTQDSKAQDRIIKATNFQIAITPASFRARDKIQRDIEDYFKTKGWFYDRRKNYYKNTGRPSSKIISIQYLAQAIIAMILREPDNARARPTTLIKSDEHYPRIFDESKSPELYLFCARAMKRVDNTIKKGYSGDELQELRDLKFHIAMVLVTKLSGNKDYDEKELSKLSYDDITEEVLETSINETHTLAKGFAPTMHWTIERSAKNKDFVVFLLDKINTHVQSKIH